MNPTPQTLISILELVGKIFGIGGFTVVLALILFRNVLRRNIFPTLEKTQAFILLLTIVILTTLITLFGIGSWIVARIYEPNPLVTLKQIGLEPTTAALVNAIENKDYPIIERFFKAGFSPDITLPSEAYHTALQYSTTIENSTLMNLLLKYGANPNLRGASAAAKEKSPLDCLMEYGSDDPIEFERSIRALIGKGANPNAAEDEDHSPLDKLIDKLDGEDKSTQETCVRTVQFLLDKGADINFISLGGTALHNACAQTHTNMRLIQLLIDRGAKVNLQKWDGTAPLSQAINDVDVVKLLLKNGADASLSDKKGWTPFLTAASNPSPLEVAKILLKNKADPKKTDSAGNNALHLLFARPYAFKDAEEDFKSWIALLTSAGVNITATNLKGEVPFFMVCGQHKPQLIPVLLQFVPDVTIKDVKGKNAFHWLVENTYEGDVSFAAAFESLKSAGVDVNALDNDGLTPLMYCSVRPPKHIAKLLLSFKALGADPSVKDRSGLTAIELINRQWVVQVFLDAGLITSDKAKELQSRVPRF